MTMTKSKRLDAVAEDPGDQSSAAGVNSPIISSPLVSSELPGLAQRPTFILQRLNAELARICNPMFRQAFDGLGVDLITSRILVIVLERRGVYVGDVVTLMGLPQSTVSHQIKRLQASGLVVRQVDSKDKRLFLLHLTAQGEQVAEQCNAMSERIYAQLFSGVGEREVAALVGQLNTMAEKLAGLEPQYIATDR